MLWNLARWKDDTRSLAYLQLRVPIPRQKVERKSLGDRRVLVVQMKYVPDRSVYKLWDVVVQEPASLRELFFREFSAPVPERRYCKVTENICVRNSSPVEFMALEKSFSRLSGETVLLLRQVRSRAECLFHAEQELSCASEPEHKIIETQPLSRTKYAVARYEDGSWWRGPSAFEAEREYEKLSLTLATIGENRNLRQNLFDYMMS